MARIDYRALRGAVLSFLQGFTCPADSGQVCGITPNPAGSNLDYGFQGFDNFAMLSLVVFQVRHCCHARALMNQTLLVQIQASCLLELYLTLTMTPALLFLLDPPASCLDRDYDPLMVLKHQDHLGEHGLQGRP